MLFLAPIGVTLVLLSLFARDVAVLASDLPDPSAMWADRSPGGRDAGALYNIKPERILAAARGRSKVLPSERVLPVTRERPVPGLDALVPGDFFLAPAEIYSDLLPIDLPAEGGGSLPYLAPMSFSPLGGGGGSGGGGGGGDDGDNPSDPPSVPRTDTPTDTPTDIPTDVPTDLPPDISDTGPTDLPPAVPEPSTWAMNILGLFLVGGTMRRRNPKGTGSALALGA